VAEPAHSLHLDSSVIVRYLTNDPPDMAERAARVIEGPAIVIVSEVILVESAYVLSTVYEITRADVVDALTAFIQRRNVRMLSLPKPSVVEALQACRESKRFSFADAMLWAQVRHSSSARICTFDDRFPRVGVDIVRPT
jgi:predicted nucleic acid-binding protein